MTFTIGACKGLVELDDEDGVILFSVVVGEAGLRMTALVDPAEARNLADALRDKANEILNR